MATEQPDHGVLSLSTTSISDDPQPFLVVDVTSPLDKIETDVDVNTNGIGNVTSQLQDGPQTFNDGMSCMSSHSLLCSAGRLSSGKGK